MSTALPVVPSVQADVWLADPAATEQLAARLAATAPSDAVVLLSGDLGAGKSTLVRAWLRSLGVTGTVRSPTYTLVEPYPLATGGTALHLDLYRIGNPGELEFLGLESSDARLWLVEWPERGVGALPPPDMQLLLSVEGSGRRCVLQPRSAEGEAWLRRLGNASVSNSSCQMI